MKNLKYYIYQRMGLLFPSFFRERMFGALRQVLDNSAYNAPEKEMHLLYKWLKPEMTIVDVGANNGAYCFYFQELVGCKDIYAFEPIPLLNSKLKRWFPRVKVFPYAISDVTEKKQLRIPYVASVIVETRAKLDNLTEAGENRFRELTVQCETLDHVLLEKTTKVDFIKIDIEGYELSAIRGAKQLISRDRPMMMVEIEARHHKSRFEEVIREISDMGYKCFFYDKPNDTLCSFDAFNVEVHQREEGREYINNFLFIPSQGERADQ